MSKPLLVNVLILATNKDHLSFLVKNFIVHFILFLTKYSPKCIKETKQMEETESRGLV